MEHRKEVAVKTTLDLEQQIADVDSKLELLSNDPENQEALLKMRFEEEQLLSEQLSQRSSGEIGDTNAARRQMLMWRGLLAMFEAKMFTAKENEHAKYIHCY